MFADNAYLWPIYRSVMYVSTGGSLLSPRKIAGVPSGGAVAQAIIKQNMCLALGSIAALALPVLLGWLPLWVAVTLHEGSTLLVALNSLRLLRWGRVARGGAGYQRRRGVRSAIGRTGASAITRP